MKRLLGVFSGLRIRLLIIVLIAVLPWLGLTIYSSLEQRQKAIAREQERILSLVRNASQFQQRLIDDAHQMLFTLSTVPAMFDQDLRACSEILTNLLSHSQGYTGFTLANSKGDIICSAPPLKRAINFSDRAWYRELLETKDFVIGNYQLGRVSGKVTVVLAHPILAGPGRVKSILTAGLDLEWMNRFLAASDLPASLTMNVVDSQGTLLMRYPDSEGLVGKPLMDLPLVQQILRQEEGVVSGMGLDGAQRLFGFTPLSPSTARVYVSVGIPQQAAFAEIRHLLVLNLVLIGVVILLAFSATIVVGSLFVLRPVKRLLDLAGNITRRDFTVRAGPVPGKGEIGRLAQAFDQMAESLQSHEKRRRRAEEQIHRLNQELEARVKERTRQLEEANKEMEAFSYSVSHDLRAPLRSLDGFSAALLEDYATLLDEQGQDFLNRIRNASQHMAGLIDDMLQLSRLSRMKLRIEPVDLSSLARAIMEELKEQEPDRQVEVEIADGLGGLGDKRLLRSVLENLLGNAWKFTRRSPQARIEFGSRPLENKPVYFIKDNGAGFDMSYVHKLFAPFQRLHRASEFEGNGIGLATVQRILRRHQGRIWAQGEVDRGATFSFTLNQNEVTG